MNAPRRGPRPAGSDTRADILGAALELFSTHGYDAVSVRMIARQAGVDVAVARAGLARRSKVMNRLSWP